MNKDEKATTAAAFLNFCATIARLRDPLTGCPWDLKQTHETLRKYMLEEAYEAIEVMTKTAPTEQLCEELGDVLLQVVLNAQLANEQAHFSILDVIQHIDLKMKRRHPHVFATDYKRSLESSELERQWQEIKHLEQKESLVDTSSLFANVTKTTFPATTRATRIGQRSREIDFDWATVQEVQSQLKEELDEVSEVLAIGNIDDVSNELGDLYFTLAQLCRHLNLDAEVIAESGNHKFLKRFSLVEDLARNDGLDLLKLSNEKKNELWARAKKL